MVYTPYTHDPGITLSLNAVTPPSRTAVDFAVSPYVPIVRTFMMFSLDTFTPAVRTAVDFILSDSPSASAFGKILIAGIWKDIASVSVIQSGAWKTVTELFVLESGLWKSTI
jgi:hypothetical protein